MCSTHTVDKVHTVESREMKDEKCNLELTCRHYISSQVNCKSLRNHLTHVACVRVGTGTALTTGTSALPEIESLKPEAEA